MSSLSSHNRGDNHRGGEEIRGFWFFVVAFFSFVGILATFFYSVHVAQSASPPVIITYQGKLISSNQAVTTTQTMAFELWDSLTDGNILYTAAGTTGATSTVSITPSSGIFAVNLGDGSTTNLLTTSTFQNNRLLYLQVVVGGQALTPRKQLTASPFAINSEFLMGMVATTTSSGTHIAHSDSNGNFEFGGDPQSSNVGGGIVFLNPDNPGVNETVLGIADNSTEKFKVDAEGDVFASGTLQIAGKATLQGVSSTNFDASGYATITGLSTLTGGFVSQSSSTVAGQSNLRTVSTTGGVTVGDYFNVDGNTTLGNAAGDTITFTGVVASNFNPQTNNSHNLGVNGTAWGSVFASGTTWLGAVANAAAATANGNLNVGGAVAIDGATDIDGTLNVAGVTTLQNTANLNGAVNFGSTSAFNDVASFNANVNVGNATSSDKVFFNSRIGTSLIPTINNIIDIGEFGRAVNDIFTSGTIYSNALSIANVSTTNFSASGWGTLGVIDSASAGYDAGDLNVGDDLVVDDALIIEGNLTVGSNNSDTVTINADLASNLIPDDNNTRDLGAFAAAFNNIFASGTSYIDSATFSQDGSITFGTTTSNGITFTGRLAADLDPSSHNTRDLGAENLAYNDVFASGTLYGNNAVLVSNATVGGNTTLGDTNSDTVTINADLASNLIPDGNNTRDLGAFAAAFNNIFASGTSYIDSATFNQDGSITFGTTTSNGITFTGRLAADLDPSSHNARDLGDVGLAYNDVFASGTLYGSDLVVVNTGAFGGTLNVTGATTLQSTLAVTGLSTLTGGFVSQASSTVASTLNVAAGFYASSTILADGNVTFNANTTLGDATSDTITPNARFASDLDPSSHNARDLGDVGLAYNDVFASGTLYGTDLVVVNSGDFGTTLTVDGATTLQSTLAVTGLSTLTGGFVSQASSTVASTLNVAAGFYASSTILADGNVTFNGNTTLGDAAASDTITLNARFASDLDPSTNNARDLGAYDLAFKNLYASSTIYLGGHQTTGTLYIRGGNLGGTATTSLVIDSLGDVTNGNLVEIRDNGTAQLKIDANGLTTLTGGVISSASSTVASTLNINQGLYASSTILADDNVTFNGTTTTIGNAATDALVVNADLASNLIPNVNNTRDLGAYGSAFNDLFASGTLRVGVINDGAIGNASGDLSIGNNFHADGRIAASTSLQVGVAAIDLSVSEQAVTIGANGTGGSFTSWMDTVIGGNAGQASTTLDVHGALTVVGHLRTRTGHNNKYDLGAFGRAWNELFVSSTANLDFVSTTLISARADNATDLGSAAIEWKDLYADGTAYVDGIRMGGNILPDSGAGNNYDLGSHTESFKSLYASTTSYLAGIHLTNGITAQLHNTYDVGAWGNAFNDVFSSGTLYLNTVSTSGRIEQRGLKPVHVAGIGRGEGTTATDDVQGVYVKGNYAYIVSRGNSSLGDSLTIIDVSDPAHPVEAGLIRDDSQGGAGNGLDNAEFVQVHGNYAYVTAIVDDSFSVFDVSSSTSPVLVSMIVDTSKGGAATNTISNLDSPRAFDIAGNIAYVAVATDDALVAIDISDPKYPKKISEIIDDGKGGKATKLDSAVAVKVVGKYAYVAATNEGISIIDISDPYNMVEVGTITTAVNAAYENPVELDVRGRYLYVVGAPAAGDGFAIADISNPASPAHMAKLNTSDVANLASANDIKVAGDYAYVTGGQNDAFMVFDISSSTNPLFEEQIVDDATETATHLDGAHRIFISGKYAYVTSDNPDDGLAIIDIGGLESPGARIGTLETSRLTVTQQAIVDGDLEVSESVHAGHLTVDGYASFSDTIKQTFSGFREITTMSSSTVSSLGIPTGIDIIGDIAYVVDNQTDSLLIIDISDRTKPRLLGSVQDSESGGTAVSLDGPYDVEVSGNYAYVVARNDDALSVIDISTSTAPVEVAYLVDDSQGGKAHHLNAPQSLSVVGRYAYIAAATDDALTIVDISNPTNPIEVSNVVDDEKGGAAQHLDGALSVDVRGSYAYVAAGADAAISVINISDPRNPIVAGTLTSSTNNIYRNITDIRVSGAYAYMTSGDIDGGNHPTGSEGFAIVDISAPNAPTLVATLTTTTEPGLIAAQNLSVAGDQVFVASYLGSDSVSRVTAIDVSSSTRPIVTTEIVDDSLGGKATRLYGAFDLDVSGNSLYVTSGEGSLSIFDIGGYTGVSAEIAHLNAGALNVAQDARVAGDFRAHGSVDVGPGGLHVEGDAGFFGKTVSHKSQANQIVFRSATTTGQQEILGEAQVVKVYDGVAYVGTSSTPRLNIYDVSDDLRPPRLLSTTGGSIDSPVTDIEIVGNYAFLVQDGNNGAHNGRLTVVDISNLSSPQVVGVQPFDATWQLTSIYVEGNYAYTTDYANDSLRIFELTNFNDLVNDAPAAVTHSTQLDGAIDVFVKDGFAYVLGAGSDYFTVVDVSDPHKVSIIGTLTSAANMDDPRALDIIGNYAYVAASDDSMLSIVDITDPTTPTVVSTVQDSGWLSPEGIQIVGNQAYVLDAGINGTGGELFVLDISSTTRPFLDQSSVDLQKDGYTFPSSMHVSGNHIYITDRGTHTLAVYETAQTELSHAKIGELFSTEGHFERDVSIDSQLRVRGGVSVGKGGILSTGPVGIYTATGTAFKVNNSAASTSVAVFNRGSALQGTILTFEQGGSSVGSISVSTGNVSYNAFTGSHYAHIPDSGEVPEVGMLVSLTGENARLRGEADTEILYGITKSQNANDGSVLGVFGGLLEGQRSHSLSNPYLVSAVGNSSLYVVDGGQDIQPGDYLISSDIAGYAMKDPETYALANIVARAGEVIEWDGVTTTVDGLPDGVKMKKISVLFDSFTRTNHSLALSVHSQNNVLTIGTSTRAFDVDLNGALNLALASSSINFASAALFNSSAPKAANAPAFILDALNFDEEEAEQYLLSVRGNGHAKFSVAANGDIHAAGNVYAQSLVAGSPGQPGDLAERVDITVGQSVEPGDVMVIDTNNVDTYRKSDSAYEQHVAGVISTNPTITVGNGKTENTAVMALTGRVPVKVSDENGVIEQGDLLVSASQSGYAMKYDPSKDDGTRMVGVIGLALESHQNGNGSIMALVRTGWVNNRAETITKLQDDLLTVAEEVGIDLTVEADELTVEEESDQLVLSGDGDINLAGRSLINLAAVTGQSGKWAIDEEGRFVTRVDTTEGEKELYALQSEDLEYIFSGSAQLADGQARVEFTTTTREIIDADKPVKVSVTLTDVAQGVYVSQKDGTGFTVIELNNATSSATFDWVVIATRDSGIDEELIEQAELEQEEQQEQVEETTEEPQEEQQAEETSSEEEETPSEGESSEQQEEESLEEEQSPVEEGQVEEVVEEEPVEQVEETTEEPQEETVVATE